MRVVQQPRRFLSPSDARRVAGTTTADDDAGLKPAVDALDGASARPRRNYLLQRQAAPNRHLTCTPMAIFTLGISSHVPSFL